MPDVTSPPSQARFQAALDTAFEIRPLDGGVGAIAARLAQVRVMHAPEGCEQFSAIFVGPAAPVHPQGTYRFAHAELGELDLFMVPLGPGRTGMQYEVCITREGPAPEPAP